MFYVKFGSVHNIDLENIYLEDLPMIKGQIRVQNLSWKCNALAKSKCRLCVMSQYYYSYSGNTFFQLRKTFMLFIKTFAELSPKIKEQGTVQTPF